MLADRFFVGAALLAVATGCAGARNAVTADDAHYPVSLSRGVRDRDGELASSDRVRKVGTFQDEKTSWSIGYSLIRLSPKRDLSLSVNEQVASAKGDAVIDLRIATTHCASNWFMIFSIIPFWPGCAKTTIEGDIVTVAPKKEQP